MQEPRDQNYYQHSEQMYLERRPWDLYHASCNPNNASPLKDLLNKRITHALGSQHLRMRQRPGRLFIIHFR